MKIPCVWEHNGNDSIVYAVNLVGAFARGCSLEEALQKMPVETAAYLRWKGDSAPEMPEIKEQVEPVVVQEKASELQIADADSDVLFAAEKGPLTVAEYQELKALVLKSAQDFLTLYQAVPDKNKSCLPVRATFYGQVPRTAQEMYDHTKNVNDYYFGEIGVPVDHEGTIAACRQRGFEQLERQPDYLNNTVYCGSYAEEWSLRKVLRRFIWHDRIHAKAMYRMAVKTFGKAAVPDVFRFEK